ncbi:MAG: DUF3108 domain-containing protein [Candidatus Latescibacterota bacterium]|nr:MAG: DUF3108 domain-containing protein [Candidatus Latescibacterota bacterium]
MSGRTLQLFERRIMLCLVVIVSATACGTGAVAAQTEADSLAIIKQISKADTISQEGDSVYPVDLTSSVDLASGVVDSLLPDFVGFGEGERLVYAVQYGIVNAGEATLEVRNIALIEDTPCYNIVSNARTNDVFSVFYKVRDRFVSLMDTTELVSLRYEKHLREGRYKNDRHVVFDQKEHKAYYEDKVIPIAPRTQDVLSAMYYVRTLPLEVGQSIAVANHTDGKNYPLLIKVLGEERVKVEAGTFDCLIVEPFLRYPGIYRQKGRVKVWVTKDRYHIPVLVKSKVIIGEVSAVLKEFRLADKFRHEQ